MLGKKNRLSRAGFIGIVVALLASGGALAATQKLPKTLKSKRKSSPSGLDQGAVGDSFQAVQGQGDLSVYEVPAVVMSIPPAPATDATQVAADVPVKAVVTLAKAPKLFDEVPVGLEDALEERLELVQKLIKEHKRAYDYRSYTVKQLREILEKLETETSS